MFGAQLATHGVQWVECSNGVNWQLDLADPCHRWIVYGYYEGGKGIQFAQRQLEDGGVYVDSGANIGQWLLFIAPQPKTKCIAIEPVESEFSWLKKCISVQAEWRVKLLAVGLGEAAGEVEIKTYGARSTIHLEWYKDKTELALETIKIRCLDDLMDELGEESIQFWKLDVEGAELGALRGASRLLKNHRIANIYIECHPDEFAETKRLLTDYGYALFKLTGADLAPYEPSSIDSTMDLVARPNK